MSGPRATSWGRAWPAAWALGLGVLLLGPALGPGFVLGYDMVWVPRLALRPDFLGLGSALPRAVPSDTVVAVLDNLVPGMLLQKVVLLGVLVLAGAGAAAMTRSAPWYSRLAATTFYVWNPFVVERLVIGHWPLLAGYAVLPWLAVMARDSRAGRSTPALGPLVVLGSLSASAGIITAVALWSSEARRGLPRRRALVLVALSAAANAPWVVSGLLHVASATSSREGARVFALHGEGLLPGPLAALGLGGIWNAEVVPVTRTGVLAVVGLVVVAALAVVAVVRRRETPRDGLPLAGLVTCWVLGWGWAVFTWAAPGASGWLGASVPGAGLMRDGSRTLALCAPLLALVVARAIAVLVPLLVERVTRSLVAVLLALVPLALMPDAAWGVSGRLGAVDYPASYDRVRAAVGDRGDVLVLPLSSYRAPTWNEGRKVLDPTGRYLRPDYLASDVLVVDRRALPGEDPRVRAVDRALAGPDPARALARLGIRTVVTDEGAPPAALREVPITLNVGGLVVQTLSDPVRRDGSVAEDVALSGAWLAFVLALLAWFPAVSSRRIRRGARA